MNKLVNYLLKTSRYKFILFSIFTLIIWTTISVMILYLLGVKSVQGDTLASKSNLYKFKYVVLFAPLFETFVFQFLIIKFIYNLFNKYKIAILMSSFIFGFAHYFNNHSIIYSVNAVIAGLIFASIYVLSKKRKDIYPFLLVWLTHLINNSVPFVIIIINRLLN